MAISDILSGEVTVDIDFMLARASAGAMSGDDVLRKKYKQSFANGSGNAQASCWLSEFGMTAAIGAGTTITIADSADPFAGIGDEVPTADPEGLKVRALIIKNTDTTNFVTMSPGTNGVTFITGNTILYPSSVVCYVFPNGSHAINDGADDEIKFVADTATCDIDVTVVYG